MSQSHGGTILERLHDQYLRGLDCDVVLTAVDHLAATGSEEPSVNANESIVWKNLACHKNVLRAAASFFDRIFYNKFTFQKLEVDEGIEGVLVSNENDSLVLLQIILHEISSHSIQALVNFAYTGYVEMEPNILKRVIDDFKIMNIRTVIEKLETRLQQELSCANCIPNLIISRAFNKEETYRKTLEFILEKFFRGIGESGNMAGSWRTCLESSLTISELESSVIDKLKAELVAEKSVISEGKFLMSILLKLVEFNCLSEEETKKFSNFLTRKQREKCSDHFQKIRLYCYTDDEEICVECLVNGHVKHHIEPIATANYNRLSPYWEKINSQVECVKLGSKDRVTAINNLARFLETEKLRDLDILDRCAEFKPKMDRLSKIFESRKLDASDNDVLAFQELVAVLEKESRRSKNDYEQAKMVSTELLLLMHKRCVSCASIADANLEIETLEDLEEIDIDQPLNTKNCISILKRSKKNGNQHLYENAFNFIVKSFIDVVKESRDSFNCRFNHVMLEEFLKLDSLKIKNEDEKVWIVKEWLQFDFRQRRRFASQLFKHVRFGCVSDKLLKEIESDPSYVIMMDEESKKLVKDAIAGACNHSPRDTKILVLGNYGASLLYDSVKEVWEEWPAKDNGRLFSAVVVGENIFIIGGQVNNVNQSKVSIYNVKTKTWKNGPNLLEARCVMGTCVNSKSSIYVVGGVNLNSAEMLNCDQNGEPIGDWQRLPPMKTARSHFEAAIIHDKVYAIGGHPNITTMEVFDPKMDIWSDCKSMSQGKDHHTVSTYNGEIYVFGSDGICEKYNAVTDTWTVIAKLTVSLSARLRGSAVLNDKVYLIGGQDYREMDIYDVVRNTWSKGPLMPKQIGWTKCVSLT